MASEGTNAIVPKILIVDDNEKNLFALETVLRGISADITRSTSGKHALGCLMQEEYALVLLDVQMPEMDGFEMAKLMRSNKHLKKVPIIFLTAISKDEKYVQEGHAVGAVDYLFKPIDENILLSKVNVFLKYYIQNKEMMMMVEQLSQAKSELIVSNEELGRLAHFDTTTGLSNRLGFSEYLEDELRKAKRFKRSLTLLFLDLDNFKYVNDNFGHHAGDELLKKVAIRLNDNVRSSDVVVRNDAEVLISRLGGDEFSIVLTEVMRPENAAKVADRIIQSINQPFLLGDNIEASIGVSIGIATYPVAGEDAETLCKSADVAMYNAKEIGKNTYRFFSEELNALHQRHILIEENLRKAMKEDQLHLAYQPIVDLDTGKTIAVEALFRCHLKEVSDVSPQEFIHVAEDSGMILELGDWMFVSAAAEAKAHIFPINSKLFVHVNVSTKQLQNDHFLKFVKNTCEQLNVSPAQFIFELTETAIMEDTDTLVTRLTQFSELGSRISIDDFGTGYSSMTWLRNLPISLLKIDKEFISGVDKNNNDKILAKSIINLAENLELTAIAEGVETEEQLAFIKKHRCALGQGFYFSKPLSIVDLVTYLKKES